MRKYILSVFIILGITTMYAQTINIWENVEMQGTKCTQEQTVNIDPKNSNHLIRFVSEPTLELFILDKTKQKTDGLVIILPGGGYGLVSYKCEGIDIAKYFNEMGISAAVLKYRVPRNLDGALMDTQRAIRLARFNANKWNIDENKIALLGFSAGANLSARASNTSESSYEPQDEIDKISAKVNMNALIYPAYLDEPTFQEFWGSKTKKVSKDYNTDYKLANNINLSENTPPTFIVQTQDDKNWRNASIAYYLALKENSTSAQLHLFSDGGHGFGLNKTNKLVDQWACLCKNWLFNEFKNTK